MCGIAGIVDLSGRPVAREVVRAMTRALAHRGPDDEGFHFAPGVGLGHRRLAIRDPGPAGRQPFLDATGRVAVCFNGEIYNDTALRDELTRRHGARFRTRCDTEVIPAGYLAWGEAVFERLEGIFAVALWDEAERRLLLARDGMGVKPLFLAEDAGPRLRFGSELKALLADPEQREEIAPEALHAFLAQGYVGPDRTLLRGVVQLPPGTVLRLDASGRQERRFWQPVRRPEITRLDDAVEAVGALLPRVVEEQLVADVPLGVLLSGGIDSALLAFTLRGRRGLPVFTARFDDASHDETPLAAATARAAGVVHHEVPVAGAGAAEDFRALVHHFDGQVSDSSGLAFHALSRAVRRHTTVVLSGDGADELFGGYPTYATTRLASALAGRLPRAPLEALRRAAAARARGREERLPWAELVARLADGLLAPGIACHAAWRRLLPADALPELYGPALRPELARDPLAGYHAALAAARGGVVDRALVADQRFYLPADMLMKVDAMSMAHALEVRVPFLDRRMVELAGRLDASLLAPVAGPPKRVLRALLRRMGAPEAVVRGRKRGFNVPLVRLLRGPLRELGDRRLDREVERLSPELSPDGVRAFWRRHREGRGSEPHGAFALLVHAEWRAQREEGALASPAPPL